MLDESSLEIGRGLRRIGSEDHISSRGARSGQIGLFAKCVLDKPNKAHRKYLIYYTLKLCAIPADMVTYLPEIEKLVKSGGLRSGPGRRALQPVGTVWRCYSGRNSVLSPRYSLDFSRRGYPLSQGSCRKCGKQCYPALPCQFTSPCDGFVLPSRYTSRQRRVPSSSESATASRTLRSTISTTFGWSILRAPRRTDIQLLSERTLGLSA